MLHPDEMLLQAYLDDELDGQSCESLRRHLGECATCREAVEGLQALSIAVRSTAAEVSASCREGDFWTCLAVRLCERRPATWPFLPYLPPFLLGVLGLTANVLISVALFAHGLHGFGLLAAVEETLAPLLSSTSLGGSLGAWLASLSLTQGQQPSGVWAGIADSFQGTLVLQSILLFQVLLFLVIMLGCLSWTICWMRPSRLARKGGK